MTKQAKQATEQEQSVPLNPASPSLQAEVLDAGQSDRTSSGRQRFKNWWKALMSISVDRQVELFLTLAIVFFAGCQIFITVNSSRSAGEQLDKLIRAAGRMNDAANRINIAANKFSTSAGNIDLGVKAAVTEMAHQADISDRARLASETLSRRSLETTIDSFHGDQRAWIAVGNATFSKDKPTESTLVVSNVGKSPATDVICRITGGVVASSHVLQASDIVYPPFVHSSNQRNCIS